MIGLWTLVMAAVAAPLSADKAVSAALERSVVLAEADAALGRASGALRAARGLPQDPTVSGSVAVVGDAWQLSVQQPVSLTGAGLAERAAAQHTVSAATAQRARVELEVAASVRRAWVDAVAARQRAKLAAEALALARQVADAARQREAVGEASQLDLRLARLQVEQARATWMSATLEDGRRTADLAARVGHDPAALELPEDPLAGAPEASGAVRPRSDLVAAAAASDAARATLQQQRASTLPSVRIGAFVEQEGTEFRAGPSASFTLPVWRANADGRAAAQAAVSVATRQQADAERRAAAEQQTMRQLTETMEDAIVDQGVDIPAEASAALDSVGLGYARGELDMLSTALLQAEILDGYVAWIEVRRVTAEARLDLLLATEDPSLLGAR